MIDFDKLKAPFDPKKISWRVGARTSDKTKGIALAYIDARDVMERLDQVCGPENWQDRYEFHGARSVCYLSIRTGGEWVTKADGAGDSDVEAEKGAISDALKRAAVKWGIGRYLYDLENTWVSLKNEKYIQESEMPKLWASLERLTGQKVTETPTPSGDDRFKSAKSFQTDLINRMNLCKSVDELEVLLNDEFDKIGRIKENYPELYEAIEHQENSIREGGVNPNPVLKFASVADAVKWAAERSEYLDANLDISEMALFEDANMPYLISLGGKPSVLDQSLSAEKYKKDGKTPSQRILDKYKFKLNALMSTQG